MTKLTQLVLIAVLGISFCFAQINRGTLTGVITDPSGAVVPGVKITATHVETGTSSTTIASESGSYTIPALPIGLYRIEFEANGFKKSIRNQVELAAGATLRQDMILEIGSVGESVQVYSSASPAGNGNHPPGHNHPGEARAGYAAVRERLHPQRSLARAHRSRNQDDRRQPTHRWWPDRPVGK